MWTRNAKREPLQGKAAPKVVPTDVSAIDLRVGVILNARKHENAESLYVEDIDCGEAQPRQVNCLWGGV